MKNFKKVLALVLVVATILSFATIASAKTSVDYNDAAKISAKYAEAIDVLSAMGVLEGSNNNFKPQNTLSRAEGAKIIAIFANGSTNISSLYAPAMTFVDCNESRLAWAKSYIAYCAGTGIVSGVGANKFNPDGELTGIALLKMVLVVLGYDADKESLQNVGSAWKANTLELARKVGLTKSLGNSFDYGKAITREEAAAIMFDALSAETVEYASKAKIAGVNIALITLAGAVSTNETLADKFGIIKTDLTYDEFYRPIYTYDIGKITLSYLHTPIATFTKAYTACDLLVAAGIAKKDTVTTRDFYFAEDGVTKGVQTLSHAACTASYGGNGALTQVFELKNPNGSKYYYVTTINTYLAKAGEAVKVTGVHEATYHTPFTVYTNATGTTLDVDGNTFVKNGYYTVSIAAGEIFVNDYVGGLYVQNVVDQVGVYATTGINGKLNGWNNQKTPGYVTIDGKAAYDAAKFFLGYDAIYTHGSTNKTYTFFYDVYGNVLGAVLVTDSAAAVVNEYIVLDAIWGYTDHADGKRKATAKVVTFDALTPTAANVLSIDLDAAATKNLLSFNDLYNQAANNADRADLIDTLFVYNTKATNLSSGYTFEKATFTPYTNVTFIKGEATMFTGAGEATPVKLAATTRFLVHDGTAYKAYTGYKALPTMTAGAAEVAVNSKGIAEFVYLKSGISYAGEMAVGYHFVTDNHSTVNIDGVEYCEQFIYIDGELMKAYRKTGTGTHDEQAFLEGAGFYAVTWKFENKVPVIETVYLDAEDALEFGLIDAVVAAAWDNGYDSKLVTFTSEGFAANLAFDITNVPVYVVSGKTITKGTAADVVATANKNKVVVAFDADLSKITPTARTPISAIYVNLTVEAN